MIGDRANEAKVLKLILHDRLVAYLEGFVDGRNRLHFVDAFRQDNHRPTFSLITHPRFPHSEKVMAEVWARNQRLHPVLSNLLPVGSLREFIAQTLKIHVDNEFLIWVMIYPERLLQSPWQQMSLRLMCLAHTEKQRQSRLIILHQQTAFHLPVCK